MLGPQADLLQPPATFSRKNEVASDVSLYELDKLGADTGVIRIDTE
jgi:hypothetical protein